MSTVFRCQVNAAREIGKLLKKNREERKKTKNYLRVKIEELPPQTGGQNFRKKLGVRTSATDRGIEFPH